MLQYVHDSLIVGHESDRSLNPSKRVATYASKQERRGPASGAAKQTPARVFSGRRRAGRRGAGDEPEEKEGDQAGGVDVRVAA